MDRQHPETLGVRRTGWAALDRDPQQDTVEFVCPHCGTRDQKNARRERTLYRFTDGFLQDLQGEVTASYCCTIRTKCAVSAPSSPTIFRSSPIDFSSPCNTKGARLSPRALFLVASLGVNLFIVYRYRQQ